MGSLIAYFENKIKKIKTRYSTSLFLASLLLIIYFLVHHEFLPFYNYKKTNSILGFNLFFSEDYKADYIFGFLVMINIVTFSNISLILNETIGDSKIFHPLSIFFEN